MSDKIIKGTLEIQNNLIVSGTIGDGTSSISPEAIVNKEDKSNKTTSISSSSTDTQYPSAKAVYDAIEALPEPMLFKGSVGDSGTISWSSLPAAASTNEGFTYKVITAHDSAPICKVGDTIISNGNEWVVIPSGDEPSGTVTSVGVSVPTGLSVSNTPITSSGTIAISYASGYSIPTTSAQSAWDAKLNQDGSNRITGQIYPSSNGSIDFGAADYKFHYGYFHRILALQSICNSTDYAVNKLDLPSKSGTIAVTSDIPTALTTTAASSWGRFPGQNYSSDITHYVTPNDIYYWNGTATGTTSYLAYCNQGAFGSIVTHSEYDYLPYKGISSDIGVNNLSPGVTSASAIQSGQYGDSHSVFLYFDHVGTPFQLQIPDSYTPYIYKRFYAGGWGDWSKMSAGYADSAGNADTLDGKHASSFFGQESISDLTGEGFGSVELNDQLPSGLSGVYTYGTYLSYKQTHSTFEVYAPHTGTASGGHIWARTGWNGDDRKNWYAFAWSGEAQPASDVYPWAKASSKPSYDFSEIGAGTAVVDYNGGIVFRSETTSWYAGIYYSTPNEEAVVFANKSQNTQDNAYQQQWLFAYTDMQDREAWTTLGEKTAMQIKGHRVAINKMVGSNTQIPYNLDVNGSANATTVTVNTKVTMQYNTNEDCLDFIFA